MPATVEACLCFPDDLSLFAGHFPEYPLVPGAILIEAVRLAIARAARTSLAIVAVTQAKFTGEVRPNTEVAVRVALARAPQSGFDATVDLRSATEPVARVRLTLLPRG